MDKTALQAARHRAVDVPGLRDKLIEAWRNGVLADILYAHPGTDVKMPVYHRDTARGVNVLWTIAEWIDWVLERLAEAELFYVNEPMTEVVMQAAAAAPTYQVFRDQLPAEVGFVVYAKPFCVVPDEVTLPGQRVELVAALWAPVPDIGGGAARPEPGLMLITLQDTGLLLRTQPTQHMVASPTALRRVIEDMARAYGPIAYHEEYPLPWGNAPWDSEPGMPVQNTAVAALFTTWILMGQRITTVEQEPMPRHLKKQAQRAGRPEPRVRTVDLRHTSHGRVTDEQQERPGEPSRRYTKRWVVKGYGYWRNTWYPSRERHELQYVHVPAYVKGPEGAPMVGGERVNVLRR